MSQFVHMTGARTMETKWFSRSWYAGFLSCRVSGRKTARTFSGNTYGEQIGHSHLTAQLASICCVEGLNRVKDPLFALFLAYFCQLKRHIAPVYESVT
ncbi:MAG: hypothetical protein GXP01_02095 [Alphaproteobacteria bacterium]|nr:hypothetical protein [Alphaproteobacteria bacterium]